MIFGRSLLGDSARPGAAIVAATAVSGIGFTVSVINAYGAPRLPRPCTSRVVDEQVIVVVPARDERQRLPALLTDLRAQSGIRDLRVLVYDDNSTDGTADAAEAVCAGDDRFTVIRGRSEPPPGWVGKPAACVAALDYVAFPQTGLVVFLDADVRIQPNAIVTACAEARSLGVGLLCPWPYQRAESWAERLVQPLLTWSWAATLPIAVANRDTRRSTAVACGQFLVFDAAVYRAIGGHRAVASSVTEDLDIARAIREAGHRTAVVVAGPYASCRMYDGGRELREGYGRWLWSAFGSSAGAVSVSAMALLSYVLPPVVIVAGRGSARRWAAAAYAAAAASRLLARTLEKGTPPTSADVVDAGAHPVSILASIGLVIASHRDHRRGRTRWKGRQIT